MFLTLRRIHECFWLSAGLSSVSDSLQVSRVFLILCRFHECFWLSAGLTSVSGRFHECSWLYAYFTCFRPCAGLPSAGFTSVSDSMEISWKFLTGFVNTSDPVQTSHVSDCRFYAFLTLCRRHVFLDLCRLHVFLTVQILCISDPVQTPCVFDPVQGTWVFLTLCRCFLPCADYMNVFWFCAGFMTLYVGGQQPGQVKTVPSNVLLHHFTIRGSVHLGKFWPLSSASHASAGR